MATKMRLISALLGIALFAVPMTASAHDHRDGRHFRAYDDAGEWRHDNGRHNGWRNHRDWYDQDAYEDEDDDGGQANTYCYDPERYYAAPYYSAGPYYGGSYCAGQQQRLRNQYLRDRRTGHPAAAQDVLRALQRLENRCGNSGLAGGFDRFATVPEYDNYGYGSNNQYYGNNGYSSMLAPLLEGFLR